jgi:hypothetical protein
MNPTADILFADLPGPSRKRTPTRYSFRLTHRSRAPDAEGCALLWEVYGGRLTYQIAVERKAGGGLVWHCTCADHVYRHEDLPGFECKHVRALRGRGRPCEPSPFDK